MQKRQDSAAVGMIIKPNRLYNLFISDRSVPQKKSLLSVKVPNTVIIITHVFIFCWKCFVREHTNKYVLKKGVVNPSSLCVTH